MGIEGLLKGELIMKYLGEQRQEQTAKHNSAI